MIPHTESFRHALASRMRLCKEQEGARRVEHNYLSFIRSNCPCFIIPECTRNLN